MKLLKKTIIFLIVLAVLPTIIISINNINEGTETITFEITYEDEEGGLYGDYDLYHAIKDIAIFDDKNYFITNIISFRINNDNMYHVLQAFEEVDEGFIVLNSNEYIEILTIFNNSPEPSKITNSSENLNVGDVIYITYKLEKPIPLTVKILLSLIPIIFVSGLLIYLKKNNSDKVLY